MHKELLVKAFEKVKEELIQEGHKKPSDSKCALRLSELISETFPYGERRLRDFYNEARANVETDINIPQPQVLFALAKYIGYDNYKDFLKKNDSKEGKELDEILCSNSTPEKKKAVDKLKGIEEAVSKRRNRFLVITLSAAVLLFIGAFGYHYFTKQRWMEWQGTQYVEASFDAEKLRTGVLKAYKSDRIESFGQVTPSCETVFFNDDGSARIWYVKNKDGSIEYFSSYGLHPRTGRALKPISQYMINKYLCK